MERWFFEDYEAGRSFSTLSRTITESDISTFVGLAGFFEPLFIDRRYLAEQTDFDGMLAPAALTLAIAEGLVILTGVLNGPAIALLSIEMKAIRPVIAGDTITVRVDVEATRRTRKSGQGLVTTHHAIINQRDETVMECTVVRMVKTRAKRPSKKEPVTGSR
jgi:acyl dehydratase